MAAKAWTDDETGILRDHYSCADRAKVMALLPGRTWLSICCKAYQLGLTGNDKAWLEEELNTLRENCATALKDDLVAMLPGRSPMAIMKNGCKLGLRRSDAAVRGTLSAVKLRAGEATRAERIMQDGFYKIYRSDHPQANSGGRVLEHIVVWEEAHGMPVPDGCVIITVIEQFGFHSGPEALTACVVIVNADLKM